MSKKSKNSTNKPDTVRQNESANINNDSVDNQDDKTLEQVHDLFDQPKANKCLEEELDEAVEQTVRNQ